MNEDIFNEASRIKREQLNTLKIISSIERGLDNSGPKPMLMTGRDILVLEDVLLQELLTAAKKLLAEQQQAFNAL